MKKWWMESVGYQIYIKSFFDGNNDVIGDLIGIYEKLNYLHLLGVNLIWICRSMIHQWMIIAMM